MADEGKIAFSAELDEKGFVNGAKNIRREVHDVTVAVEQSGAKMDDVFDKLKKNVVGVFAVSQLVQFQKKIIEVRGEMEKLQISLQTLAGESIGKQLYEDIKQFATTTPMMMGDLAKGAQTLLGFNIEAKKIMPILRQIGDISMGDAQKFNSLALAFAQMSSTGKLMGQDLLQMINAGFNPLVQISEKTGKTVAELKEEMSQGKITVEMVEDAFRAATEEGGKFNGMLEKQSKGMAGAISNLQGAYEEMLNDIGEQQEGILVDGINLVTDMLKHYEDFANVILTVIAAYGSYKAVLLLTAAAQKAVALYDNIKLIMMYRKELGLATAAQQAFNTSLKANPVGLIVGALSGIIAATMLFKSKTEESTEALERLRDAALGEMQKLQTYRAVLENVSKTSNQYKNTLRDLNAMAEEYHVTLFTENDTVDELRDKYNELTEAIHSNTAERLLSEAASKATKDAMDKEKEAMDELMKDAKDASYYTMEEVQQNVDGVWIKVWDSVEHNSGNIRAITSTTWNQISSIVMENARDMSNAFDESNEKGEKSVAELVSQIEDILRSLGVTDKEIQGFHDDLYSYVKTSAKGFQEAYGDLKRSESQLEGYKRSMVEAKDVTNDSIDGMNYEQLQDELAKVQKEIDKVNDKTINPNVDTSRLKVLEDMLQRIRDLMPGQLTEGSDSALEKRLRKLKEDRDSYTFGTEAWKKKNEEIKTLTATLNAHKKSYAENAEKGSRSGESTAQRTAQLRKQREEFFAEQRAQARELERGEFDLWSQTEQAAIAAMQDGNDKTIRQINLNFEQRKEELRRQYEDLRREKWEADKRLWESNPDNKNKPFAGRETDERYNPTEDERTMYARQREYAQTEYERQIEAQAKAERQHLYDYLKQYGTFQEQRAAITAEYDQKIADASSAAERASLQRQKGQLIEELNFKEIQSELNWEEVFGDLSRQSVSALRTMKERLRAALDAKDITAENAKVISEKIREIEDKITDKSDVWASILPGLRERRRLTQQAAQAEEQYAAAVSRSAEAANKVLEQKKLIKTLLDTKGGRDALGQKIEIDLSAIGVDMMESIMQMFHVDENSELGRKLSEAFRELEKTTTDLQAAEEKKTASQRRSEALDGLTSGGSLKNFFKDIFNTEGMGFTEIVSLVNQNAQSMSELVDNIGLGNTEFGESVHNFAEGVGGFNSAIQSLASGDVFGAINGIVDGFQGFGKMLGIGGGNAEKVNEAINRLNERNAILTDSIDRLNDTMSKQGGAKAIKTYEEILRQQKELEKNIKEQLELQMGYHDAHKSFNKYWNEEGRLQQSRGLIDTLNSIFGTNLSYDLSNMDAETAAAILQSPDLRQLISDTGKGGYGERVMEWIERLAAQAGKAQEATDNLYASLTGGTTRDSVYSDFLSDLYDLANGVDDVAENIEKRWQEMVNKMVIDNIMGDKMKDKVDAWYNELAELNRRYSSEGSLMSEDEYRRELERMKEAYEGLMSDAEDDLKAVTEMGIVKPIEEAANESLITLSTIKDGWLDMLMDVSKDTEEWANDIAKLMTQAIIQSAIFNDQWEQQQKEWLDRYEEALNDQTITDAQREQLLKGLQADQEAWIEDARRKAKQIMEMTGYSEGGKEQSATVRAMERITVDQADELIGRMNAGQMIWEQHKDVAVQIQQNIAAMQDVVRAGTNGINSLVSLAQTRNQHLNNILSACQGIRNDMMEHLDKLNNIEKKI